MSQQVALSNIASRQPRSSAESGPVLKVTTADTDHVIERIQQELQLLLFEHTAVLKRIGLIKHTLAGLADIFGSDTINEEVQHVLCKHGGHYGKRSHPGLTETCRRILMEVSQPLTVRRLCDRIRQDDPSLLERHKDPTASVAVVLKRLVSYGEVLDGLNEKDGRTWLWAGTLRHDGVKADQTSHH